MGTKNTATEIYHIADQKGMYLYGTCSGVSGDEYENLFKGTKQVSGKHIRKLIKKHIPDLYYAIGLEFPNPYEHQSRVKDGLFIYIHSAIDYFIKIN